MADYIVNEGMDGYLDPPQYPTHYYSVRSGPKHNPHSCMSLPFAVVADYIDSSVCDRATALIQAWKDNRPNIDTPECQKWIADCQRHWANCWYSSEPVYGSHAASAHSKHPQPRPADAIDYATYHIQRFYPEWRPQ